MTTRIDQFSSPAAADGGSGTGEVNVWIIPDFAGQLTAIGEYLLTLPPDTIVLPGHGPETTIAMAEKEFNYWVSAGPSSLVD